MDTGRLYQLRFKVDLIFVDIQMPDLTGIELIRTLEEPSKITGK